jgi:hypothetical protein
MSLNLVGARDPGNKVRPIRVTTEGKLLVEATLDVGTLATTTDVDGVSEAVAATTTAVDQLKATLEGTIATIETVNVVKTISTFMSTSLDLLDDESLDGGQGSQPVDISGYAFVNIYYYDKTTDAAAKVKGLFVELSHEASFPTPTHWMRPEIQLQPASITTTNYPSLPDEDVSRHVFLGPLKVAGFKSLRIVHQDSAAGDAFVNATARLVASSI